MNPRIIEKAKQLKEIDINGQSALSDIAKILYEVYTWGVMDTKFPSWGENVDAVQITSAESKVRGTRSSG